MSKKKTANTNQCLLCSETVQPGPLLDHYLANKPLLRFIRSRQPQWELDLPICANCLEQFSKEHGQAQHGDYELTGERTVITAVDEQIKAVPAVSHEIPSLLVIHGSHFGKKYDITDQPLILGRSDKTDIHINEENVSRQHAQVSQTPAGVVIEDLGSTNGTFVNTKKVPKVLLKDGDLIMIGNTILKFISGANVEGVYHQEIYKLATIDGLTQVYNKSYWLDRLLEEFGRSKRYGRPLTLMLFDFDHFKRLNDEHGHPAGDLVLKQSCQSIMRNLRKEDTFGRYGGEEFAILFPETAQNIALKLAEKIRQLIEREVYKMDHKQLHATISIGVATTTAAIQDAKQLLKLADQALYEAKRAGRNRVFCAQG